MQYINYNGAHVRAASPPAHSMRILLYIKTEMNNFVVVAIAYLWTIFSYCFGEYHVNF
jgi:hypothetical protein